MKICILTSGHRPLDDRIFYKEALTLKKKYNDITIIGPHNDTTDFIDSIKIISINKRKKRWNRFKSLYQLYQKGIQIRADIYHCHEPDSLFIGNLIKRKLDCKLIYDCHEYHPEAFAEQMPFFIKRIIQTMVYQLERLLAKNADNIITVNDILVRKFKKYHQEVIKVPNYARLEMFDLKNVDYEKSIDFIYVGKISKIRGISKILEAGGILKERAVRFNIHFIGKVDATYYDNELNKYIQSHDLIKEVKFHGYLNHKDVYSILKKAKVGLVLLQPEIYRYTISEPVKLFEYLGNGLPVIANDYEIVRNIILKYNCGILVDPTSPYKIADAMEEMLKNSEYWHEKGKRGLVAVKETYNWDKYGAELLNAYEKMERH